MPVSAATRRFVFQRAFYLCEYCLLHESDAYLPHQIEHIISQKHEGQNAPSNLACACVLCNRTKGADLSTILPPSLEVVRFYRPRTDRWLDHFELSGSLILPKTDIGKATVKGLALNDESKVEEREILIFKGRFPHPNCVYLWNSQL
jgi:hypothetical protein